MRRRAAGAERNAAAGLDRRAVIRQKDHRPGEEKRKSK